MWKTPPPIVTSSFGGDAGKDLVAYAKANPGKVSYASAGVGNGAHLIGELLQLFEPVRDVEHGRAARAQIAHQRKQPL